MHTTRTLRRHGVRRVLAMGSLGLIAAVVLGEAAGGDGAKGSEGEKAAKRNAEDAAKMVDAIANRNKPPKIVEREKVCPSRLPLFSKDYDWEEEHRVRKALTKLSENRSPEVWDALVQKVNDRRYCIASYSGNSSDVKMYDVGQICHGLAYGRLCYVFERHLPSLPPHGCPIYLREVGNDLPAWRKQRKDKSLYQLQIEVCEMALCEIRKTDVNVISDPEKAKARKAIQAEIAELRRTKRPDTEGGGIPPAYPLDEAGRVREAYEKKALEEFESGLNK